MSTQYGQIMFAAGEDVVETLTVYGSDNSTTINISGFAIDFVLTEPGGRTLLTYVSPTNINVALPAPCQAQINFAAGDTSATAAGYYDFSINRTDAGARTELTSGTLMLTSPRGG